VRTLPASHRERTEITMVAVYVLTLIVVLLVIYLFYAVINPQKF
jgi:K+-transporting ATPase KdpF subunit